VVVEKIAYTTCHLPSTLENRFGSLIGCNSRPINISIDDIQQNICKISHNDCICFNPSAITMLILESCVIEDGIMGGCCGKQKRIPHERVVTAKSRIANARGIIPYPIASEILARMRESRGCTR
jgi:hypothetical protein